MMTREIINAAANQYADQVWPIAGDPTFPESREQSDGWCKVRDGFIHGATSKTMTADDTLEIDEAAAYGAGMIAGFWFVHPQPMIPMHKSYRFGDNCRR